MQPRPRTERSTQRHDIHPSLRRQQKDEPILLGPTFGRVIVGAGLAAAELPLPPASPDRARRCDHPESRPLIPGPAFPPASSAVFPRLSLTRSASSSHSLSWSYLLPSRLHGAIPVRIAQSLVFRATLATRSSCRLADSDAPHATKVQLEEQYGRLLACSKTLFGVFPRCGKPENIRSDYRQELSPEVLQI